MKTIQEIPLKQIDITDETFSVNFMPDLQRLRSSLQTVGLIQPVLLKRRERDYQIVSGFRRVWVWQELERDSISAMVFGGQEKNDLEFFLLSLEENLTTRRFNMVEKAMALQKLHRLFQVDSLEIIKTYLPLFSLEPHEKILNTFLALAEMEEEVKTYILREEVSRFNIRLFGKMGSEDRLTLIPILSHLKLGESRLREMLTLLLEISQRDGQRIKDILRRSDLQSILSQKELTPPQRTERVKKFLFCLRNPRMSEKEEAFKKKVASFHLPEGISIHPPPFFEGRGMKLAFQFRTTEEYRAVVDFLSKLGGKEEFKALIQNF